MAQVEMFYILNVPVFTIKNDIVLPEWGRRVSTADELVIAEDSGKIVGLKGVDFLACDKIHRVCPE